MSEPLQFMAPFTVGAQLEARAAHEVCGPKVFLMQDDRTWTYRQLRDESVRTAHFLRGRLEPIDDGAPGHVAMLLENHFELRVAALRRLRLCRATRSSASTPACAARRSPACSTNRGRAC